MRKIEQKMIMALARGQAINAGNTAVTARYRVPGGYYSNVFLHGNEIAKLYFDGITDHMPRKMRVTLAGWPTVTTRSRLNALGQAFGINGHSIANQSKGKQYINDSAVNASEWVDVKTKIHAAEEVTA